MFSCAFIKTGFRHKVLNARMMKKNKSYFTFRKKFPTNLSKMLPLNFTGYVESLKVSFHVERERF